MARRRLERFPNAAVVQTAFEDWRMEAGVFRAVIAAQSWHWIDPELRFAKAARALCPGGVLAVFGHVPMAPPAPVARAFAPILAALAPELGNEPVENWYLADGPLPGLFIRSGVFEFPLHRRYGWSVIRTGESLARHLRTTSPYQRLELDRREALLRSLSLAVDRIGGAFEQRWESHLYLARRSD